MPSGTSEKGKLGRISKLVDTDYAIAWLDWLNNHGKEMVENAAIFGPDLMLAAFKHAFDAGWNARGLADLAIIHDYRKHNHG